jgi:pimeloyl-ACP methyl ester carboxylesterase
VFGEHSHIVDDNSLRLMDEATEGTVPSFIIPGASHYPMVDDPLKFVATIRAIACQWVADRHREQR